MNMGDELEFSRDEDDKEVVEYVEEFFHGQVVHGEDGQYYVVMDKDTPDFDFEKLNNVQVVLNEDGTKTLLMEDTLQKENLLGDPSTSNFDKSMANTKIAEDEGIVELDGEHDSLNNEILEEDLKQYQGGVKQRRSRVYGTCKCPECDQAFVNTARLERHLAVHQIFGSFLCPLCGKTYKYEYNLFYHWRRTCRDMNDLLSVNDRKNMEVTNLRHLVEEIAQKKSVIGPLELGISGHHLYQTSNNTIDRLEVSPSAILAVPNNYSGMLFKQKVNVGNLSQNEMAGQHRLRKPAIFGETLNEEEENEMEQHLANESQSEPTTSAGVSGPSGVVNQHLQHQQNMRGEELDEKWMTDQGIVFADDLLDDEDMLMINEDGQLCSVIGSRGGIVTSGALNAANGISGNAFSNVNTVNSYSAIHPLDAERFVSHPNQAVQCQECFRSFANIARLERHVAGVHSSYGTHHCVLCGNRFKYDYNLLYHLRRACSYTKSLIEEELREQLPAVSLKKLVRNLANKEVRLQSQPLLANAAFNALGGQRPDLGDSMIRQQMMRAVMPASQRNQQDSNGSPVILAPPPSKNAAARPGFPDGKKCPVCSIVFYGLNILARHLKVAHPADYETWEGELEAEEEEYQRQQHQEEEVDDPNILEEETQHNLRDLQHSQPSHHSQQRIAKQIFAQQQAPPQHSYRLRQRVSRQRQESIASGVEIEYENEEEAEVAEVDISESCEIEPPPTLQPEPEVEDPNGTYEVVYQEPEWEFFS